MEQSGLRMGAAVFAAGTVRRTLALTFAVAVIWLSVWWALT